MKDTDVNQSNTIKHNIRLILRFEVESEGLPMQKEVRLELEPSGNRPDLNPLLLINRTTAAIVRLLGGAGATEDIRFKLKGFTPREMDVFTHLITGATNMEIGKELGVSANTIKFHVKNIFEKLDVKNRVELTARFS